MKPDVDRAARTPHRRWMGDSMCLQGFVETEITEARSTQSTGGGYQVLIGLDAYGWVIV